MSYFGAHASVFQGQSHMYHPLDLKSRENFHRPSLCRKMTQTQPVHLNLTSWGVSGLCNLSNKGNNINAYHPMHKYLSALLSYITAAMEIILGVAYLWRYFGCCTLKHSSFNDLNPLLFLRLCHF
ncbi:hypothetical protein AMTRI_Chr04g181000 [Amborella trichopoda]